MDCSQCEQLTVEFEEAETRYATARVHLKLFRRSSSTLTYLTFKQFADDALLEYEAARIELEQHQSTHGQERANGPELQFL